MALLTDNASTRYFKGVSYKKRLPYPEPFKKLPDKAVFFLFHTPTGQIPPEVPLPAPARIFPG